MKVAPSVERTGIVFLGCRIAAASLVHYISICWALHKHWKKQCIMKLSKGYPL